MTECLKWVSLGCLPFELTHDRVNASDWPDLLRESLDTVTNIKNLKIEIDPRVGLFDEFPGVEYLETKIDSRERFWPQPAGALIEFEINIPRKLHQKLFPSGVRLDLLECENFLVRTRYEYFGPISFVYSLTENEKLENASFAITLVTEFLLQELDPQKGISVCRLHGNPFPVEAKIDKSLNRLENSKLPITFELRGAKGFQIINFNYDASIITNPTVVHICLEEIIKDELSLYYLMWRRLQQRVDKANELRELTNALIEKNQKTGKRATFGRVVKAGPQARLLGLKALGAKLENSSHFSYARTFMDGLKNQNDCLNSFSDILERVLNEDTISEQIQNTLETVDFVESSRVIEFSAYVTAASGILGAIIGALAVAAVAWL